MSTRYGARLVLQDYMEYPEKLVVRPCLDCGSIVLDQAAHDAHHDTPPLDKGWLKQLEAERTMASPAYRSPA